VIVFRGGTVLTGEPTRPTASAAAVEDGAIAALGDDALALQRRADEVVELTGHTLVPAFRDGHIHPLWGGAETLDAPIVDATDVDDVVGRVAAFARDHPERPWVTGHGYPPEIVPGGVAGRRGQGPPVRAVVERPPHGLVQHPGASDGRDRLGNP
jgi:predicted amidohydrolase YtcJ